jgi:hypothetical protein
MVTTISKRTFPFMSNNKALFIVSKILPVYQDLLSFALTIELSLQSVHIPAASKHWKKVTFIIQLVASYIEVAPKKQDPCQS